MSEAPQDWEGLGFNPAPGAAHVVDNLANKMGKLANHLQEVYAILHRITTGSDDTWTGEAADAFKKHIEHLPTWIRDASDGAAQAREALHSWYQTLAENEPKAWDLEARAKTARTHLRKATTEHGNASSNPDLELAGQHFDTPAALADAKQRYKYATDQLDRATHALNSAHDDLTSLIRQAHSLEDDHQSVARAKARAIREAADNTADPDWNDLADFWDQHGGDLLGTLSGIVGIASFFCPALAPVAVLLSLAAMTQHTVQYAQQGTLWPPQKHIGNYLSLGGDVLGAIPGIGMVSKGVGAVKGAGAAADAVHAADTVGDAARAADSASGAAQGAKTTAGKFWGGVMKEVDESGPSPLVKDITERTAKRLRPNHVFAPEEMAKIVDRAQLGVDTTTTAAGAPSLATDNDTVGYVGGVSGGVGNVLGGVKDGVAGTAIGIASMVGTGFVAGGAN